MYYFLIFIQDAQLFLFYIMELSFRNSDFWHNNNLSYCTHYNVWCINVILAFKTIYFIH